MPETVLLQTLRDAAVSLAGTPADEDAVLDIIGHASVVLLGEASRGSAEFYRTRAALTRRLISERGFTAVAVEADWPDAYRVNCYVRGAGTDTTAEDALRGFKRFPTWMWRNTVVRDFVAWLRDYNAALPEGATRAGFYGLDLYSLYGSIEAVVRYLDRVDPEVAARARARYACFEHFDQDTEEYAYATGMGRAEACEDDVVAQLIDLQKHAADYRSGDGRVADDEYFFAEQNARLVKNAEEYYRAMFRGRVSTWNLRDCHMAETLQALIAHLSRQGEAAKVVVWAHNSHLGDARATEMGEHGELNIGQLVRQHCGDQAFSLGFTTYTGTVTAASNWGAVAERKQVRPGLPGSYEALFHDTGIHAFLLPLGGSMVAEALNEPRLERAIGVIYRPETERWSHYFHARLSAQFDAVIHVDRTKAVEPLERTQPWDSAELPETYPLNV